MNNETALDVLALLKKMKEGVRHECYTSVRQSLSGLVLEWRFYPNGIESGERSNRYSTMVTPALLQDASANIVELAIKKAIKEINV